MSETPLIRSAKMLLDYAIPRKCDDEGSMGCIRCNVIRVCNAVLCDEIVRQEREEIKQVLCLTDLNYEPNLAVAVKATLTALEHRNAELAKEVAEKAKRIAFLEEARDGSDKERDELAKRVGELKAKLDTIEKAIPCGFYYDEALSERVRIMVKHWRDQGDRIEGLASDRDRLTAQLAEAQAGWRPISEAPRDGTEILIFFPYAHKDGGAVRSTYWFQDAWHYMVPHDCWRWPTHWMPLPTPPEA